MKVRDRQTFIAPVEFPEFVVIWNWYQGLSTPALHVKMARWLGECWRAGDSELLLLAFRNSGKSTLVGLFLAWLLLANPNMRIVVLSGEFSIAKKMVRNVKRLIEKHPLTRKLRPAHTENWAASEFTVNRSAELRDPSVLAKGISGNITGLRADVIVCDDVEVPNTADTISKRFALRERLQEIEYVLVPGGMKLFVGTPHSYYSIYSAEARPESGQSKAFLEGYKRFEAPLLNAKGESAWPERFPISKIESIKRRTGPAKFESQMLLRPRNVSDSRLDVERLRYYDLELSYTEGNKETILSLGDRRLISVSCWWDPSYGSPNCGDSSVIAAVYTDEMGYYWLHRVLYLQHDPAQADKVDEATQLCRQVVSMVRDLYLPAVTLETNGIGRFLPGLLRSELRRAGLACAVIERTSSRNKDIRIVDGFDSVLAAGRLWVHRSVRESKFIEEMREWRPGARGRDDALDAVAGCLLNEPVRLPRTIPVTPLPSSAKPWRAQPTYVIAENGFWPLR